LKILGSLLLALSLQLGGRVVSLREALSARLAAVNFVLVNSSHILILNILLDLSVMSPHLFQKLTQAQTLCDASLRIELVLPLNMGLLFFHPGTNVGYQSLVITITSSGVLLLQEPWWPIEAWLISRLLLCRAIELGLIVGHCSLVLSYSLDKPGNLALVFRASSGHLGFVLFTIFLHPLVACLFYQQCLDLGAIEQY